MVGFSAVAAKGRNSSDKNANDKKKTVCFMITLGVKELCQDEKKNRFLFLIFEA